MKKLILLSMVSMLTACGGGSDGAPAKAPDNNSGGSTQPPVSETETGMQALEVSSEFDFRTNISVVVQVAGNVVTDRAFLNICKHDAVLTNDEECFVRAPLSSDGLTMHFELPHQEQKLKAEIWFYNPDMEPHSYTWQYDASQDEQTWAIN